MLAGDQLREILGATEVEALMPFATRLYPDVTPEQSVNRWLADAEKTIEAAERFANTNVR